MPITGAAAWQPTTPYQTPAAAEAAAEIEQLRRAEEARSPGEHALVAAAQWPSGRKQANQLAKYQRRESLRQQKKTAKPSYRYRQATAKAAAAKREAEERGEFIGRGWKGRTPSPKKRRHKQTDRRRKR